MWLTRDKRCYWVEIRRNYRPYVNGSIEADDPDTIDMPITDFKKLFGWTPKQLSHTYVTEIRMDGKINNVS